MADSVGMLDIRGENIAKAVKVFAEREFVFKPLCSVESSNKWKETYYKETVTDLTGGTGNAIEDVPRLAVFPHVEGTWTEVSKRHKKHGAETRISHEDVKTSAFDVATRSLRKVARAIAKSVDAEIWDVITEGRSVQTINTLAIAAGHEWDSDTVSQRDPIQDILNALKLIEEDDYDAAGNGVLCLNPKDKANLLGNANVRNAGQFYTDEVTRNGVVGFGVGLKWVVSNNVTAGYAAIVIPKEAATWKSVDPLTTKTIEDPGIGITIRSWEIGSCQLKAPNAVCLISNTAK